MTPDLHAVITSKRVLASGNTSLIYGNYPPNRTWMWMAVILLFMGIAPTWAGVGVQIIQNGQFSRYPIVSGTNYLIAAGTDLGAWQSGQIYANTDVSPAQARVAVQIAALTGTGTNPNQTSFPGDAPNGLPASTTWLLSRGTTAATDIWYQNISVLPSTTYTFSYYASNASIVGNTLTSVPAVQFLLDGVAQGSQILANETAASGGDKWTRFTYSFTTSASQNNVELRLRNTTSGTNGNQLGLVNISCRAAVANSGGNYSCDGEFKQIRQVNNGGGGNSTRLFTVVRSISPYATVQTQELTGTLNALGYNPLDGNFYALTYTGNVSGGTNPQTDRASSPSAVVELNRLGQGGIESLGIVTGLPVDQWAAGTMDRNGILYVKSQTNSSVIYKIDVTTSPATATSITTTAFTIFDMAYNPVDNFIYGVYAPGVVYKIDPNTGTTTSVGTANVADALGTAFIDLSGTLYAYGNNGNFYVINKTTGAATPLSTIDGASNSDGANCINPLQRLDVVKEVTNVVSIAVNQFDITYAIRIKNTGTITDDNVQVSDLLRGNSANTAFPTANTTVLQGSINVQNLNGSSLSASASFTGVSGDANLLTGTQSLTPGQRASITYTVRVTFTIGSVPSVAQNNTAYGTSTSSSPNAGYTQVTDGTLVPPIDLLANDASTNGAILPPSRGSINDPGDSPSPTPVTFAPSISGTIFEDINYGGGLGRTQGNSTGVGRGGVRVELYNGSGATALYSGTSVITAADGTYSFINLTAGSSYVARVVNSSVTSSRVGATASLVPVQTYRTQVTSAAGTVPDQSRVGGEDPSRTDAANGASGTTLALLNVPSVTGVSIGTIAESQSPITLSVNNAPAVNVDFGYNFDLVVNTNNAGQGSLRQFITNSNALGDEASLAQSGSNTAGALPAQKETSIFMIPDGAAHPGLLASGSGGPASQLTTQNGQRVAVITPATATAALPAITGANTSIDGTTQTQNIGNTNSLALGTGGTVGVNGSALSAVSGPEVQIVGIQGAANSEIGLSITANNTTITGLAIYGFGNTGGGAAGTGNTGTGGDIVVGAGAVSGISITGNVLGTMATSFTDPGATTRSTSYGILFSGNPATTLTTALVANNLIAYHSTGGIEIRDLATTNTATTSAYVAATSTGIYIENNEIRGNAIGSPVADGVSSSVGGGLIRNNLFAANDGPGVDILATTANVTVYNNTLSGNGVGTSVSGAAGIGQTSAIRANGSGNTISQNIISNNYGAGVLLRPTASTTVITQNSIVGNGTVVATNGTAATGQIGIDLEISTDNTNTGTAPYVTLNNSVATGTNANGLVNYPIITSASISGTNLTVKGYARAGAVIELFSVGGTADPSGFGEGQKYLASLTEGSAADTDGSTNQSYSGFINSLNQGSDNTANGFSFTISLASLNGGTLALGSFLSSTATLGGATSEFSGNVQVRDITVANDDQSTTTPGVAITFAVTGNDTPNAELNTATIDLDPNTPGIQTSFPVAGGTFTTVGVAAGSVKFTPANATFVGVATTPYTVQNTSGATSNQANLIVRVESQLDVATTISAPATVVAGGLITVSGTTQNNSLAGTASVNVAQSLQLPVGIPTGSTILVNSSNQTVSAALTATGLFTFGTVTLAPGGSTPYSVRFTAPLTGPFAVTALVNPAANDINLANNTAVALVTVTPQKDISTTITGPGTNPVAGSLITYVVTTANSATSSPASDVVQTVQLPASVTGVFATNGGVYSASTGTLVFNGVSYSAAANTVTFPPVSLAAGQTVSNTVSFIAPVLGTVLNSVTATVPTTDDPVTGNNTSTATSVTTQAGTVDKANLYVTITGPSQTAANATVNYTVTQGNNGPSLANNVQTVVSLPPSLSAVTVTDGSAVYNSTTGLLTLSPIATQKNATTPVSYGISFTAPAASSSITAVASVSSDTSDPVPADNVAVTQTELIPSADVAITITTPAGAGNLTAGQRLVYNVATQNTSDYAAQNVKQTVAIFAGLSETNLQLNGATGTRSAGVITFTGGETYNVQSGLLSLVPVSKLVKGNILNNTISFVPNAVSTATGVRAVATVTSSTADAVPANNTATLNNGFNNVQDLTVSVAGPSRAIIGSPVLYTVTTTNNGPSVNGNETTTVQLPTGLTGVEVRDNTGTVVTGAYVATTGLVTFATSTAVPLVGQSVQGTISFLAPDATQLSLAAVVALTSPSASNYDANVDNNTARISTTLVLPSLASADLATTFTATPATSLTPGSAVSYTIRTTNNGTADAKNLVQLVSLPVGLPVGSLTLGGATGSLAAGIISFAGGATYNVGTGLLTIPGTSTVTNGSTVQSTVAFLMPPATITVTATSASDNPDAVSTNNIARATTTTTTTADVSLAISGPPNAAAGAAVNYLVVATNNGPSTASTVTATFTLPPTVTTYSVNGAASITTTAGSTITLQPSSQTLLSGASLSYIVSFNAPTSTFNPAASVTAAAGSNTNAGNDNASVKTLVNVTPTANDVVNNLQSPQGNTAVGGLSLTSLSATDIDGSIVSYTVTALPLTGQGVLYYNGTPATTSTVITDGSLLSFKPAAGFVGSVFFTYTATDNGNGVTADAQTSVPARYTIQVGQDFNSVYTATTSKGGASQYQNNDVLASVIDPNRAVYSSDTPIGLVYNPSGTTSTILAAGASNGLRTVGGAGAVQAPSGSGPTASGVYPANPTNVMPAGVSLDPITGLIYVSDRLLLVRYRTVNYFQVNVTTTDINGGTNLVTAQFSIGSFPLPVELTDFTAIAVKNVDAALAWHTASEKNNDHFDVERSLTGTDFVKIGEVKGQGTSTAPVAYSLTDAGIGPKASGQVYYRLKQVDTDGASTYSPVRTVSFTKVAGVSAISLWPNPATSATQLDLTNLPAGSYQVRMLDATGRVVLSTVLEAGLAHALDLNTMASGTYMVLVSGQANGQTLKLTKRLIKE